MGNFLVPVDLGTDRYAIGLAVGHHYQNCALLDDYSIKCWGYNGNGNLGYGDTNNRGDAVNEMGDNLPVVDVGTGRYAVALYAGSYHFCVLLDNDTIKCWGYNNEGQLGQGDINYRGDAANEMGDNLAVIDLGSGFDVVDSCGSDVTINRTVLYDETSTLYSCSNQDLMGGHHTCFMSSTGSLKCWGYNSYGSLGYGDTTNRGYTGGQMGDALAIVDVGTGRTVVRGAGTWHSECVILDNTDLKCWGYNPYGNLGYGHTSNLGDGSGEMGDSLLAVDLGTNRYALLVFAGGYHLCAILDNHDLKCWGYNNAGQLGYGDMNNRGDGANEMGNYLKAVDLGSDRYALLAALGYQHTCAILDDSSVKCWGYNGHGNLGLGHTSNLGDGAGEMGDSLPTVDVGSSRYAVSIGGGYYHTCVLLDDGSIKCWGYNPYGNLGLGDTANRGDAAYEMGNFLLPVDLGTDRYAIGLAVGHHYQNCALLDDYLIKCWGYNGHGNLGYGDMNV
jgi:alpha-tubulin suppressor-like RCC1 family protein